MITSNPYVGPRTFGRHEADRFFGREREARDLFSLVVAERVVLFYAQSGAGKSSLLNTRLIPQLQEEAQYLVLPVGRVGGELQKGIEDVANIYVFNLLLSINQDSANQTTDPSRFAQMEIKEFLTGLYTADGEHYFYDEKVAQQTITEAPQPQNQPPHVLIIDQFEEIVTTHLHRWQDRNDFFHQLDEAIKDDPNLWVVLTLREDFVAALEPYARLVSGGLRTRFYMERLDVAAAIEAVRRPAAELGDRSFAAGVAEALVNNLRRIRVHGSDSTGLGQYVEPVQLQVVCYQLWESIAQQPVGPIQMADLQGAGDVDQALATFYEDSLKAVLAEPTVAVSERQLRTWFDNKLITEAGTRGTIYQGEEQAAGMSNRVVRMLQDRFLLRAELRAGGAWIELVHDRFVDPIRSANLRWQLTYENPLERAARAWLAASRDSVRLASAKQLSELQAYAKLNYDDITSDEQSFLEASKQKVLDAVSRKRALFVSVLVSSSAILFLVIAALLTAAGLRGTWQPVEPVLYAGAVTVSAAAIPLNGLEAVYAITNSGPNRNDTATLLKLTPENDTWNILARNLTANIVNTMLVVNAEGNDRIYVSKKSTGLIRSDDQGQSWQEINSGLTSRDISVLVMEPTNPQTLYAGSGDGRGVFQSVDGGDTWRNISDEQGFVGLTVLSMVYSTHQTHRLLVGTDDGRIVAYDQDNAIWRNISARPGTGRISAMAVEPTRTEVLYAGTSTGKILRSDDGGENWYLISNATPVGFAINSLVVVPFAPDRIYVNAWGIGGMVLWKSIDGGRTWAHTVDDSFTRQTLQWLLISPSNPEVLHVAGDAGMFTTKDGGRTWRFHEMGSPQVPVEGIALSAADPGPVYITHGGAIFSNDFEDDNSQWRRGQGLPATIVRDVITALKDPNVAYAAVYLQNEWSVFLTDDHGVTWRETGLPLIPEPLLGDTMALELGEIESGEILYAGTNGCGVFHSLDRGLTWETFGRRDCKLQSITAPQNVIDIQATRANAEHLYVAADSTRLYVSSDRGKNWQEYEVPITTQITKIALDPFQSNRIYLIAGLGGFWRSEDGGQHWTAMSSGLENSLLVDLVAVPDRAQTLFVAAESGEVWKTTNGGRTWTSIRYNLPLTQIGALDFDVRRSELWIGSRVGGLFRYQPGFLESYQLRSMSAR